MNPITGFAAGAGAGLMGDLIGANSQTATNSANAAMGVSQMAFQQEMSDTAYQRSVSDIKAAGLNPGLMFGSGGGESSPSGAMPVMSSPGASFSNLGGQAASAIGAYNQSASTTADVLKKTSETQDLIPAEVASEEAKATAASAAAGASKSSAHLADTQAKLQAALQSKADVFSKGYKFLSDSIDGASSAVQKFRQNVQDLGKQHNVDLDLLH